MDRVLSEFLDVREIAVPPQGFAAWRARDPYNGKELLVRRLPDSASRTRAMQAVGLHHPGIARTSRWIRDGGFLYLIRDWVPGENLRARLADPSRRGFHELRHVLDPVLDALAFAHDAGFSHGSLTPENVVVDGRQAVITDFGPYPIRNGARSRYLAPGLLGSQSPTPRGDYYALCELYKEFLPERPASDAVGADARARLMRNLTEAQRSAATADELRYKLDAINTMAEILGFAGSQESGKVGPRLVCQVTPSTVVIPPGSGATVALTVWNEGDAPLKIDSLVSDRVWLNFTIKPQLVIVPDAEYDLMLTVSAARLQPGTQSAHVTIQWSFDLPAPGATVEHIQREHAVTIPVLVTGPAAPPQGPVPLAERLPAAPTPAPGPSFGREMPPPTAQPPPAPAPASGVSSEAAVTCFQEPDPAVVFFGESGVLHIGIRNVGQRRIRIDRIGTWPRWLVYPGEFQPIWIEPGAVQYLGLSVEASTLPGGDYNATVRLVTTVDEPAAIGRRTVWGETKCDARVRVVRRDTAAAVSNAGGCAPILIMAALMLMGVAAACVACIR